MNGHRVWRWRQLLVSLASLSWYSLQIRITVPFLSARSLSVRIRVPDVIWAGFWGIIYRKFFWDMIEGTLGPAGLM